MNEISSTRSLSERRRALAGWLGRSGLSHADLVRLTAADAHARRAALGELASALAWLRRPDDSAPWLVQSVMRKHVAERTRRAARSVSDAAELLALTDDLLLFRAVPSYAAGQGSPSAEERRGPSLTAREAQVLALLAEAMSNQQIATALGISQKTVKNHVTAIYAKLGVSSRIEALTVALGRGLVPTPRG